MSEPTRTPHQLRISAGMRAYWKRRKAAQDWPATDSRLNYEVAIKEIRRRKIEAGEIDPPRLRQFQIERLSKGKVTADE